MAIKVTIFNRIGEKLDENKLNNGITKAWVADQMGISRQALNILINTKNPTIESLVKLAHVLKCHVHELYTFIIEDM